MDPIISLPLHIFSILSFKVIYLLLKLKFVFLVKYQNSAPYTAVDSMDHIFKIVIPVY
jgi:hypothetical protein